MRVIAFLCQACGAPSGFLHTGTCDQCGKEALGAEFQVGMSEALKMFICSCGQIKKMEMGALRCPKNCNLPTVEIKEV